MIMMVPPSMMNTGPKILFFEWVILTEHKWVILGERRGFFDQDSAAPAVHPPHPVQERHQQTPKRNEFKPSLLQWIVAGTALMTAGADRSRAVPGPQPYFDALLIRREFRPFRDQPRKTMTVV